MNTITNNTYIFDSLPLENVLDFYSNPAAYPELKDKIFRDYVENQKYLECCETYSMYKSLMHSEFHIYYKLTKYNFESRGFEYNLGLNIDKKRFNPSGCCSGGGLYFCELKDIHQFESFGNYLTPIIVPKNIPIYKETHERCSHEKNSYEKLKAPCIYILPRIKIDNPIVNDFICKSASLNNRFINCTLYKSENIKDLTMFMNYAAKAPFWLDEKDLARIKIYIHEYKTILLTPTSNTKITYPKLNPNFERMNIIKQICHSQLVFEKNIVDFLIEHAMPSQIEDMSKRLFAIDSLNLNPENYSMWFKEPEKELFSKCCIVAAGSSVLRCISEKKFIPNDIDLYINKNNMEDFVNSAKYEIKDLNKNKINVNYNMKNIVGIKQIKIPVKTLDQYGYEKINIKKYQLIILDADPQVFIKENFDFDLCAIGYDFKSESFVNLIQKPDYSILKIQQSYINKMCGNTTDSYSRYRAKKTFERIQKYMLRGFYIENWQEYLEAIRDKMCD